MAQERIQVATNLRGPARRVQFMGREHISVPATLVRSQVLHNNLGRTFLPADAITPEWAEASNGAPVVIDHPNTSARSPEVLNRLGVGQLFNVRAENGALKGDVYLDAARSEAVEGLRAVLAKLDAGDKVEGSTGFPVVLEETAGVHNGAEFDVTIRPAGGLDHYATFAEKTGACSVSDGCGLAANHEGECAMDSGTEKKLGNVLDRMLAFFASGKNAEDTDDGAPAPDDDTKEEVTMNREKMIAQLAEAGPLDADALGKLSDCQLKALSGADEPTPEPTGGDSEAWRVAHQYRRENEELKAKYEPARNEQEKERAQLMDDLLYNSERLPYSPDEIRAMDIVEMRKVHSLAFPKRTDYSGLGAPSAGNAGMGAFGFVQGIMDGPRGTSALDKKEAN